MGICCKRDIILYGEDFIFQLLNDDNFTLKNYTYTELLKYLEEKIEYIDNDIIEKGEIARNILPIFYNDNDIKIESAYYRKIFDTIIDNLEENNNIYFIILIFYPFLNSLTGASSNDLIFILKKISPTLSLNEIVPLLRKYINIITRELTKAVKDICTDREIIESLDNLLTYFYTEENIDNLIGKIKEDLERETESNKRIKEGTLKFVLIKYNLGNLKYIRYKIIEEEN